MLHVAKRDDGGLARPRRRDAEDELRPGREDRVRHQLLDEEGLEDGGDVALREVRPREEVPNVGSPTPSARPDFHLTI